MLRLFKWLINHLQCDKATIKHIKDRTTNAKTATPFNQDNFSFLTLFSVSLYFVFKSPMKCSAKKQNKPKGRNVMMINHVFILIPNLHKTTVSIANVYKQSTVISTIIPQL